MRILYGLDTPLPTSEPSVVTLGAFDGIHRGHQELLNRIKTIAAERGGTGILLTFEPHPQRVIAPGTAPPLLSIREEKLALLEEMGLDTLVILPFNRQLSQMEAEDFVRIVLVEALDVRFLVLGNDHAFGKGRRGRPELLRTMALELGFEVEVVDAVTDNGDSISSSLIRKIILNGDVQRARHLLGRPYSMKGLVIRGDQRGMELGFPTANISLPNPEKCIPGNGVYAVRSIVGGSMYSGACNIGTRPTFNNGQRVIEVHLFEFDQDIYGESIEVMFFTWLREEKTFEGPEALKKQIENDVTDAERSLAQEGN